jgi:mono/diheme cytochrome c family protein
VVKSRLLRSGSPCATCALILIVGATIQAGQSLSAASRFQSAVSSPVSAQGLIRTIWDGVYTREQARRGQAAYKQTCGYCHGLDLGGSEVAGELAPELEGAIFLLRWDGPLSQLFAKIDDEMPKDAPGSVTSEAATDIVSYLLEANEARAGDAELQPDRQKLKEILVTRKPPKR